MRSTEQRSSDATATEAFAADLAERLGPGDVVIVSGELGAGKTTFVRGASRALGVEEPVVSPTFTIGRRYPAASGFVSHLDLYRLDGLEVEDPGLLDDYLTPDAVTFIEWPEAAIRELPRITARVHLEHAGHDQRLITIEELR